MAKAKTARHARATKASKDAKESADVQDVAVTVEEVGTVKGKLESLAKRYHMNGDHADAATLEDVLASYDQLAVQAGLLDEADPALATEEPTPATTDDSEK